MSSENGWPQLWEILIGDPAVQDWIQDQEARFAPAIKQTRLAMAYMSVLGECAVCHKAFYYNADKVPSTSVFTGTREPVCRSCMDLLNERRKNLGIEPFPILDGAYEDEEVP